MDWKDDGVAVMYTEDISQFPWLCSTISGYSDGCSSDVGNLVTEDESDEQDIATQESYGTYGMKFQYYAITYNLDRDQMWAEDQLRWVTRSWYFDGYVNSIPPNVRSYQLQGIWGEDVITVYAGIPSFDYFSTYGGSDKNTPEVYDVWKPKIGDVIYLPYNNMFYDIRDVKYFDEAFGLRPHTYTLTCKVYKDDKYTVSANPTLGPEDPIWNVATSAEYASTQFDDYLRQNDIVKEHSNANVPDVEYIPKEKIEDKTDIDVFTGW